MNIKDIMNKKIIYAKTSNSIYEISNLMKKYNIGIVPIKDETNLIGVITDRDIVIKCISNNCDIDSTIEGYISKNIITIDYNENVDNALKLMSDKQIKRLIVTKNNKPIGILSISDILNNYEYNITDTLRKIWKLQDNHLNKTTEIDEFYL